LGGGGFLFPSVGRLLQTRVILWNVSENFEYPYIFNV